MTEKIQVAVLMGGRSGEHDVSLASGRAVLDNLPGDRFACLKVVLSREGLWQLPGGEGAGLELPEGLRELLRLGPDVVFIAMHGPEGEDGKLQSLLDLVGLPYVGSDAYASSLAMNKPRAKDVYRVHGIPVAPDWLVDRAGWAADRAGVVAEVRARFTPPWVLKTPKLGSSVGLSIVPPEGDLETTLDELFDVDDQVLVEQFVAGRELTCAVLDTPTLGPTRPLPLVEITPVDEPYFNYRAKYEPGAAREVCPAPVDDQVRQQVQALGVRAHRILGCRGVSRTDFILAADGALVALETNTIPGLTETSLLPQAAAADGLSFSELLAGLTLGALKGQAV